MNRLTLHLNTVRISWSALGAVSSLNNLKFKLYDSFISVLYKETASPCRYDEGSPLIQNGIAVGVMSRNKGCTAPYPPTVYTRLSAHYSWILRIGGTQPPLPATPYPTPTAGTTFTSSTTQPTTTESTALPTTASTTQGTTTKFVVPTAPCYNCIP